MTADLLACLVRTVLANCSTCGGHGTVNPMGETPTPCPACAELRQRAATR